MKPEGHAGGYDVHTELSKADEALGRFLVTFEMVDKPTPDEDRLAKDIVVLDHRSLRLLGAQSPERAEVRDLVTNAVGFFHQRDPQVARSLLERAEAVFLQHMQAKNRLRYLIGVGIGCGAVSLFGVLLYLVPGLTGGLIAEQQLPAVLLFSFLGTVTSVMLRLSSIDLRDQTNAILILCSGASRPLTAAIFALVLYLLVEAKFVELHLGLRDDLSQHCLYLLVSFLCGFSERFASDILSRFGGELGPVAVKGSPSHGGAPKRP